MKVTLNVANMMCRTFGGTRNNITTHPDSKKGWSKAKRAFLNENCVRHAHDSIYFARSLSGTTVGGW